MQFGVVVPNFGEYFHPRTLAALAADAESAGWDGFFLWDHLIYGSFPAVDPWVALAAIALNTERIRIGTMVTPLPRRNPLKLAREAVSIDHLSDGRLILGIGLGGGYEDWETGNIGGESDMRVRGDMLDEGLELLTKIWSGEVVDHTGKHYHVRPRRWDGGGISPIPPRPVQSRIPIWVAGTWPNRRPMRRAARCDGINPMCRGVGLGAMMSPDQLREIVEYVRGERTSDEPFDVVMSGHSSGVDVKADERLVESYESVGATWWFEDVSPWAFGWEWQGSWPVPQMNERIRQGPPGTGSSRRSSAPGAMSAN